MTKPIIKLENIDITFYQKRRTIEAVKDVSITINKGNIYGIVGYSGAGKSTLLQILGTLSTPDEGSLEVDGTDVLALRGDALARFRNRRVGFVFQFHHLLPEFTALENVMIPALIGGSSSKEADAASRELLEKVGLKDRMGHKPSELSGGEQQRVAIARALVNSPAVLFADEPSGNLDTRTKEEIHSLFFELRDSLGQTIVIVTHDASLARLCDRTLYMKDGLFVPESEALLK